MEKQKGFLYLFMALFLGICFAMISPFLGYILTGLILAFLFLPLKQRLDKYMSPGFSSGLVVLITVIGAILPLIFIIGFVANDASNLVSSMNQAGGLDLSSVEQQIEAVIGTEVALEESVRTGVQAVGSFIFSSTSQIVGLASSLVIGLSLMLFIQFYGLKEGRKALNWTKNFDLMPTDVQNDFYQDTAKTTRAVVKGHIFVAIITGVLTGLGLFATGIPNPFFWSFMAVIAGMIPIVGVALIWVPAAIYLIITGAIVPAILLALYEIFLIGGADNFLRPYMVDDDADLHPLFILLGIIGGLSVFGVIGIFVGPIIFGVAKSLLNIYQENLEKFS